MNTNKISFTTLLLAVFGLLALQTVSGPPQARAEVFERFLGMARQMADYPAGSTSEPRRVVINNNTTWLQISRTRDTIPQVLEFYEKEAARSDGLPANLLHTVKDPELRQALAQIDQLFRKLSGLGNFKLLRRDYGFLGTVELHEIPESKAERRQLAELARQGKFGELATARLVMALRDKEDRQTTVITLRTGTEFDLNNFKTGPSGDRPGFDITGVPRYPSAQRTFSLEQESDAGRQRLVMYRSEGSLASNILFFHARMAAAGWSPDPHFEELARQTDNQGAMLYSQQGRECMIQVSRNQQDNSIHTTVIEKI